MKTAIIIVTYNRLELLKECIECALKQKNEETELVIVNNNCTDGTYEYLKSLSNERIHCLHENDNIGGAGGFHDGLKYAVENTKCDWFLLIDDDAMISSDYLHKIYSKIVPSVKAYAGTVLVDGEIDTSHRLLKGVGAIPREKYNNQVVKCDFATFCGLLVSRELVMKIGYPREDFFIWHDDTEYCYRVLKESEINLITDACLNHKTVLFKKHKEKNVRDNWKCYYGFRNELVIYKQENMKRKYYWKVFKLVAKAIQLRVNAFFDNTHREDFIYNSNLRMTAIRDMRNGNMGKSKMYP